LGSIEAQVSNKNLANDDLLWWVIFLACCRVRGWPFRFSIVILSPKRRYQMLPLPLRK
jgi:hypothetical protein